MLKCAVHFDEETTPESSRKILGDLVTHFQAEAGQAFYAMQPKRNAAACISYEKIAGIKPDMIFIPKDCRTLLERVDEEVIPSIERIHRVYPDTPIVWYNPLAPSNYQDRELLHSFRKAARHVSLFMTAADKVDTFRLLKNRVRNNPEAKAQSTPYFSAAPELKIGEYAIGDLDITILPKKKGFVSVRGKVIDGIRPLGAAMLSVLASNMDTITRPDDMMAALYRGSNKVPAKKILDIVKHNTNKALAQHGLGQIENCWGVGMYAEARHFTL